jgi:hypothetical protein
MLRIDYSRLFWLLFAVFPYENHEGKPRIWFSFLHTPFWFSLLYSPLIRSFIYFLRGISSNMYRAEDSGYVEMDPTGRYGRVCMLTPLLSFHSRIQSLWLVCFSL